MARMGGTSRRWSPEELAALREWYPVRGGTWDGWAERLPGRTPASIRRMANRVGLRAWSAWTPREDEVLRQRYASTPLSWPGWARLLPGRTPAAIRQRGERLGVARAHPWTAAERRRLLAAVVSAGAAVGHTPAECVRELSRLAGGGGLA